MLSNCYYGFKMDEIILIGAGGHCKSCIEVLENLNSFKISGVIDRDGSKETHFMNYPILGYDRDLIDLKNKYSYAHIAIGQFKNVNKRKELYINLKNLGFTLPSIIAKTAYVSKNSHIGEGTIVMHQAFINSGAIIGKNCIINTKSLIEHDVIVNDFCHIATGAIVNGGVKVGENSFIGSQSTTKQNIKISSNSFVKAGEISK